MAIVPEGPHSWDCDPDIDVAAVNVNISGVNGYETNLTGRNDWSSLNFRFQCRGGFADGAPIDEDIDELTLEEALDHRVRWPWLWPTLDLEPRCADDLVAMDGTGTTRVLIYGSSELDVSTIDTWTLRLSGARAVATQVLDEDLDGYHDLVAEFEAVDLMGADPDVPLHLYAARTNSQVVYGFVSPQWVQTATDADGDGVHDLCDACPAVAGAPASVEGCP